MTNHADQYLLTVTHRYSAARKPRRNTHLLGADESAAKVKALGILNAIMLRGWTLTEKSARNGNIDFVLLNSRNSQMVMATLRPPDHATKKRPIKGFDAPQQMWVCPVCDGPSLPSNVNDQPHRAVGLNVCEDCESQMRDNPVVSEAFVVMDLLDDPSTEWTDETLHDAVTALAKGIKVMMAASDVYTECLPVTL